MQVRAQNVGTSDLGPPPQWRGLSWSRIALKAASPSRAVCASLPFSIHSSLSASPLHPDDGWQAGPLARAFRTEYFRLPERPLRHQALLSPRRKYKHWAMRPADEQSPIAAVLHPKAPLHHLPADGVVPGADSRWSDQDRLPPPRSAAHPRLRRTGPSADCRRSTLETVRFAAEDSRHGHQTSPAPAGRGARHRGQTVPQSGVSRPAASARIVDLPPPLGPTSATVSPGATRSDTSFTTGSFSPVNVKATSSSSRPPREFVRLYPVGACFIAFRWPSNGCTRRAASVHRPISNAAIRSGATISPSEKENTTTAAKISGVILCEATRAAPLSSAPRMAP